MASGVTPESGLDEYCSYEDAGRHVAEGGVDVSAMAGSILDEVPDVSVEVTV